MFDRLLLHIGWKGRPGWHKLKSNIFEIEKHQNHYFFIVEKNWKCNVKKLRSFNVFDFTKLLNCLPPGNQIKPVKDHTLAKSWTKLKRYYIPDGTTGGRLKVAQYINKKFSKSWQILKSYLKLLESNPPARPAARPGGGAARPPTRPRVGGGEGYSAKRCDPPTL